VSTAPSSRGKILEVAESLFARRGFSGVGLQEVADAAGLGKSSLFHHFRSKSQLYLEALGGVLSRIQERLEPVLAAELGPVEKLDRCVDALIDALAEHPNTARLLLRALFEEDDLDPGLPEFQDTERTLEKILGSIRRLLQEGVAAGVFRSASVPHTMQTLIGATVYHFASGELGETLIGAELYSAAAVGRHKRELKNLLHSGLARASGS
jgi:TetR/AcrR family transcriptional repressor of nem operon